MSSGRSARRFPNIKLMVDANSAYTLADADHLKRLDEFYLMMIEQPLAHDDIIDHAALQARLDTPICLDECIRSAHHAEQAIAMRACRIINIKLGRVGGFAEARRVHDVAQARGHSGLVRRHARSGYRPRAQYCPCPRCPISSCRATSPPASAIGNATSLLRRSRLPRMERSRFATSPVSATTSTPVSWIPSPSARKRSADHPPPMSGFVNLLRRNRNYRYTWLGQIVSEVGDHFNTIAVFSLALNNTGSGLIVSGLMISRAIPAVMAGPVAGVLLDRMDRKHLMIASDLCARGCRVLLRLCGQAEPDLVALPAERAADVRLAVLHQRPLRDPSHHHH